MFNLIRVDFGFLGFSSSQLIFSISTR